jgi:phage terminase large subunit-like protein
VAAWRFVDAWDQLMFGLRLGTDPRGVVTTTPRPTKLIKDLAAAATTIVTRGATKDNATNLAQSFLAKIVEKYQGTRLGRQELDGEILDDNPGALWKRAQIDATRVLRAPDLSRLVVGVDPAVSSKEDSDLTGIVSAGRDDQNPPHFYVLEDSSKVDTPMGWATQVVKSYHAQAADRIVGEVNNGGDLVETVIRAVDPNVAYTAVHATRGKAVRAEPIAALYEQGRVHHVGAFAQLEDEMCDWDPLTSTKSPDRMDALVWALTELSEDGPGQGILGYIRELKAAKEETA